MSELLNTIRRVLAEEGVTVWSISRQEVSSAELFFIRKDLDMRRMKQTVKYPVTVYRPFEKDGKPMLGASEAVIIPAQSEEDIRQTIRDTYFAASFVANPAYELPEKQVCDPMVMESDLTALTVEQTAMKMAEALFAADTEKTSFLNSAEIFATKSTTRLLTSKGTDVCYTKYGVRGEFVTQCKEPEDVEMYHNFAYDKLDTASLTELARTALHRMSDRAVAKPVLPTGTYDVILSDKHLAEIMDYYTERTHVAMVYPGYSDWKVGTEVHPDREGGEALNLTLHATVPYSGEGIPMKDRKLLEDGKVCLLHGGARLSSYLGIPATGDYRAVYCDNGTVPFADMKKKPYLYPVCFSDFQMNSFTGHFGGEIRLAYWFDGKEIHLVTGGSINGSIADCGGKMVFSLEKYDSENYHGPYAVSLPGVKVAGTV